MWPRNDGRSTSPTALGGAGPGLGELPGDAPDLHDRHAQRVGQHDRHLQDDAQLLPDVVGRELLERLGAVAGLEQERVAGGDLGQRRLQRAGLAGEHQRGIAGDRLQRPVAARRRRASRAAGRRDGAATRTASRPRVIGAASLTGCGDLPRTAIGHRTTVRCRPAPDRDCSRWRSAPVGQTARMRSASSRRPTTARLTRRRAASAVTPSCSPTSRKLLRSPSSRPKRASTA